MFALTQIDATTSYWGYILPVLFVMGLGMGATMMPLMTSALKTLTSHQVARGSTLLNISQQIASSIGVAVMSVVLTNGLKNDPLLTQAQGFQEASQGASPDQVPGLLQQFPEVAAILGALRRGPRGRAGRRSWPPSTRPWPRRSRTTFWVAAVLRLAHPHPGSDAAQAPGGLAPARRREARGRRTARRAALSRAAPGRTTRCGRGAARRAPEPAVEPSPRGAVRAAIGHAGAMRPGPHNAITDVPGVRVGHTTLDDDGWLTGVTVVVPPAGTTAGVDVRGGGPGTRETDLLDPRALVDAVDAVVLSGGSAFGLATADGVARAAYEAGAGWPVVPRPAPACRSCRRPSSSTSAAAAPG